MVEDNPGDVWLVREAIELYGVPVELYLVQDGEQAITYIQQAEITPGFQCPDIVLLDLNLPKRSGKEVLRYLKSSGKWENVPVVIMTSSDSQYDRTEVSQLGATSYFRKPPDYEAFLKLGEMLNTVLGSGRSEVA